MMLWIRFQLSYTIFFYWKQTLCWIKEDTIWVDTIWLVRFSFFNLKTHSKLFNTDGLTKYLLYNLDKLLNIQTFQICYLEQTTYVS